MVIDVLLVTLYFFFIGCEFLFFFFVRKINIFFSLLNISMIIPNTHTFKNFIDDELSNKVGYNCF